MITTFVSLITKRERLANRVLNTAFVDEEASEEARLELEQVKTALFYVNHFNARQMLRRLAYCSHGILHCPVCSNPQQWPSRATRGDLIP